MRKKILLASILCLGLIFSISKTSAATDDTVSLLLGRTLSVTKVYTEPTKIPKTISVKKGYLKVSGNKTVYIKNASTLKIQSKKKLSSGKWRATFSGIVSANSVLIK